MRIPLVILGLTGIMGPVMLMRELMTASGGDTRGAVVILTASWLWVAVGAWLAEYRGRGVPFDQEAVGTWSRPYAGTLVLVALFLPLQIVLARATPRDWLGGWGGVGLGALLSAPLGLVLGAQYALGRCLLEIQEKVPGRAFVYQAIGAALAGLLFVGLLTPLFNLVQVALLTAGLNLAAGWWMGNSSGLSLAEGIADPVYTYLLMAGAVSLAALALPIGAAVEETTLARQWPGLTAVKDSSRGRIVVVGAEDGNQVYWAGTALFGVPDERGEAVVRWALTAHPHARSLMLVGGGPSGLTAALAESLGVIHYAEPDDELVGFWRGELPAEVTDALADGRLTLADTDARTYLEQVSCRFDLIVVNLPGPVSDPLNRYYTVEFWALAGQASSPGGTLVARLPGPANEGNAACVAGVRAALMRQFPSVKEVGEGQLLLAGILDQDLEVETGLDQKVNRDLVPTCPANMALLARPPMAGLVGWATKYGWLAGPVVLLFLVGLIRRDLRVPLLPAFASLAGGATLAGAMVGAQRASGLLYAGAAELLMAYAVGIAIAGGAVALLVGFLKQRARLALMAAALLAQSLVAVVEPGLISHLAGEGIFPWAIIGLVAVAGLPVGGTLAIAGSQGRPGAAFVAASAGGAIGAGLAGLLIIPSAGMVVAGQAMAVLMLPGLVWLLQAE